MKPLSQFFRSVLPADRSQLIFLGGVVCLIVAPHLRWWPKEPFQESLRQLLDANGDAVRATFVSFLSLAVWPITFAGMAGYFVIFWPGDRPTRRIVFSILLPAASALTFLSIVFLYLTHRPASVFESTGDLFRNTIPWPAMLWSLGPGFHFCLLGIVMIAGFAQRLASGKSSLPLALLVQPLLALEDAGWEQFKLLIWVLLGPISLAGSLFLLVTIQLPTIIFSGIPTFVQGPWFFRWSTVVGSALTLVVAFWAMRDTGWQAARQAVRMPQLKYSLLGGAVPVGISLAVSTSYYLVDRMQWAAHDFGKYAPPQFTNYFRSPDAWLLLLFFAAFSEELIFRGILQPRFVERYGTVRGIFFVGVVWGAFHFFSDSFSGRSDLGVLEKLVSRIAICLALGFVLGWITLRSDSVLPATIAHTLFNVMVFSQPGFPGFGIARTALWAGLAYVLFRYWPLSITQRSEDVLLDATPEVTS